MSGKSYCQETENKEKSYQGKIDFFFTVLTLILLIIAAVPKNSAHMILMHRICC